jgi:hypothetical protein
VTEFAFLLGRLSASHGSVCSPVPLARKLEIQLLLYMSAETIVVTMTSQSGRAIRSCLLRKVVRAEPKTFFRRMMTDKIIPNTFYASPSTLCTGSAFSSMALHFGAEWGGYAA